MNILFFTSTKVCSTSGGTERATISTATGLTKRYNCRCFSLYERPSETPKENCFVAEFCWANKGGMNERLDYLKEIVVKNQLSFVIIQGSFIHTKLFVQKLEGTKCKVVFAHHFEPGSEKRFLTFEYFIHHLNLKSLKGICRSLYNFCLFPYVNKKGIRELKNHYQDTYNYAQMVVLLSRSFIEPYKEFAGVTEDSKFDLIPNALSFNEFADAESLYKKKKIVLIVARFDDKFKNISLALRIWAQVQQYPAAKEWLLKIVGHGKDRGMYEKIIYNEHIPNVSLEGRQAPIPYYREASLFMMTSNSESWGLTLTEAMQFGTVPIALHTYPSLPEIITDQQDGIIIPKRDIDKYIKEMLRLMEDAETRNTMALDAIESSKRFSQAAIADKWYKLLTDISEH